MLDKFINEHVGKKNDNGYGAYPGECVSLVQRWNKVLGNPRQWGNGEAYRTNLVKNKLGVHVPLDQARSGDVIAGLNNSHIYGHVALVINSTQVLEQPGPTAGGDGKAKVGTIANFVKRYPNYKVTRLHAYKYVEPIAKNNDKEIIVGSKVKIKQGSFYQGSDKGKPVSAYAYSKVHTVKQITNGNALLSEINSWVAIKDLVGENEPKNNDKEIIVGSKVKIKQGSFYQGSDKGKPVSAYAYSKVHTVKQITNGNALLSEINSWVAIKDLVKVN